MTGEPKSRYEIHICILSYALLHAKKCYIYHQLWCGAINNLTAQAVHEINYLMNTRKMFILNFQICILNNVFIDHNR
jgi:hypothetical protein